MSELPTWLAELPPQKRKFLSLLLQQKGVEFNTFPLSFAQQRLWFLDQLEPGSSTYNGAGAIHLSGTLRLVALERSLQEITRRHEVLRTIFLDLQGQAVQLVRESINLTLPIVDLRALPQEQRTARADELAAAEARRPFDLARGPLVRTRLLRLDEQEYVVLVTMHHIVADGWSLGIFMRELVALYKSFSEGRPLSLPELPIQYADFASWQRQWMQGRVLDARLSYWKTQLGGELPTLELPLDHPRPAISTLRGAKQALVLPRSLSEKLKALSEKQGVTLYMTLLAAFYTLLYCYTGQRDIVIGSPIANRDRSEIEGLIGFFVNTLALRIRPACDLSFRELLKHVREVTLGAYTHQDLPFEKLVEELQPDRSLSRNPLFQVMFAFQNVPMPALELAELKLRLAEGDSGTAKFDLTLSLWEQAETIGGWFEYSVDLFDEATIGRMCGHFQTLLEAIVADPDKRLAALPLLTPAEQHQILFEWNDTGEERPPDQCFQQLFEAQVARTPDALALSFAGQQLTYEQLNARANQLAHHLQRLGVKPEVRVGISLERSVEMCVALLGVLKAGGAYVPLDPSQPPERLAFMLEDSGVTLLLTQERFLERLPKHHARVVCLDTERDSFDSQSVENPHGGIMPENLAYVIYTSGSTGRPKAVMIPHRAVVEHNLAFRRQLKIEATDRILQFYSINSDVMVEELFPSWLSGAAVILQPEQMLASLADFLKLIRDERLTILNLPSSYWHEWVLELSRSREPLPPTLRRVIVGSEEALAARFALWRELVGDGVLFCNAYGPTEATITSTIYHPAASLEARALNYLPIGRPIANCVAYILNRQLQATPTNVPGELHIGGEGLARGYDNDPAQTAERFIPDPFSTKPGRRLYKTGDLASYRHDGNIEFRGRLDQQVKLRGFRIELGEIETALTQHPSVRKAVVVVREDAGTARRLVAYVVRNKETSATVGQLRSFLRDRLPEYMTPSAFVFLEELPLLPSGKVNRRALPAPQEERAGLEMPFVAPRTPVEEELAGIWSEILGVEQAGRSDNFFELGGHSLLAIQVISRVRDAFQVEVPLRRLFETPTLAGLAEHIERALRGESNQLPLPIQPLSRESQLPLSFAQQRLWFLDRLMPESPAYNLPAALHLSGPLNVAALEQSLNEIIRRHEILRTTLPARDGWPVQVVAAPGRLKLPVTDLSGLPETMRHVALRQLSEEEARRPFELSKGPLLRARLLRLSGTEQVLLLIMHHIISDGWSMKIFAAELATLWKNFSSGEPSTLPELPVQYADFAHWHRCWLEQGVLEAQLKYWREQLKDAPLALELPTDYPRAAVHSARGARHYFELSPSLAKSLEELSRTQGGTLFMTLLAAFQVTLHYYAGRDDLLVGTDVAYRNLAETEGLIGLFVNQLVLRADCSGNPTFRELLQRTREVTLGAYTHQDVPFDKLVEALKPERDISRNPLFQVMFVFDDAGAQPLHLEGLTLSLQELDNGGSPFDFSLLISKTSHAIKALFRYNADLFKPHTMSRMAEHFETLLSTVVARPEARIEDLREVLTGVDRQRQAASVQALQRARLQKYQQIKRKAVLSGD
jgi:amino acid adenylation domain-containing protein